MNSISPILWTDVDLILNVLIPVDIPNFDSVKGTADIVVSYLKVAGSLSSCIQIQFVKVTYIM